MIRAAGLAVLIAAAIVIAVLSVLAATLIYAGSLST